MRDLFTHGDLSEPAALDFLYQTWRAGTLDVKRTWGNAAEQGQPVPYQPDACFLPDDHLLWTPEAKQSLTIATWNINSLRTRLELMLQWLATAKPDVVGLQETKVEDSLFPLWDVQSAGYQCAFAGQKSYNGVAIFSRHAPEEIRVGFRNGYDADNRRLIAAYIQGLWFVNVYVPQGQSADSEKFAYKLEFLEQLREEVAHYPTERLVLMGDLNIALDERDVVDPAAMRDVVSFRPEERESLQKVMALGLQDSFRKFHRDGGHYSWWDYRTRGFERNEGMRIDHILMPPKLCEQLTDCFIDLENRSQPKPSDHAPVLCHLTISE